MGFLKGIGDFFKGANQHNVWFDELTSLNNRSDVFKLVKSKKETLSKDDWENYQGFLRANRAYSRKFGDGLDAQFEELAEYAESLDYE